MFSGTQSIESSAFPYFQNPIWGKHIGKLEIRRSKYNKRLFSVSLGNSICAIKSVLTVLVDFPPKQTMSFFRDTIDKWLMALNVGEQNYCNIKTIAENQSNIYRLGFQLRKCQPIVLCVLHYYHYHRTTLSNLCFILDVLPFLVPVLISQLWKCSKLTKIV